MCVDPVSMGAAVSGLSTALGGAGAIGTALTVGAGAISAIGSFQNARMQQAVGERNARAQEVAAREALEAGRTASDRQRRAGAGAQAGQRAMMAANGIDVSTGDGLSILDETAMFTREDAFAIRESALSQGRDLMQGAANSRAQGRMEAYNSRMEGFKTILGTGARVGQRYSAWAAESFA